MVAQSEPMQMQTPPRLYATAHNGELVIWQNGNRVGSFSGTALTYVVLEGAKALQEGMENG